MTSIGQEVVTKTSEIQEPYVCIGPLNFNRQTKEVTTVMQSPLNLDQREFDALYTLASREGEALTFDMIYAMVWDAMESTDEREAARLALSQLSEKVKEAGTGFMWIDYKPKSGYMFKMRWRRNGNNN